MQVINEILNFGEEKLSFLDRISMRFKRILLYFSGLRSTIYVMICYYILKREPEEFDLLRKVVYLFLFVNLVDFALRKLRSRKAQETTKVVSLSLHVTAVIILFIVLKKANISIRNFTLLKHFVRNTIKENTTPVVKIQRLLPFILFPILLINSIIESLKDYVDFNDQETLKKYYDSFTGKINVDEYFKDIPIYKKILSNSILLIKSIKDKNSTITGLILLNQIFNCIDINIVDKKSNLLLGSVYKILVDFYVLINPLLEILNGLIYRDTKIILK